MIRPSPANQTMPVVVIDGSFMDPILVYVAVRRPPVGLEKPGTSKAANPLTMDRLPDRTLLLFVDELRTLYGPSLWSRPQFAFAFEP